MASDNEYQDKHSPRGIIALSIILMIILMIGFLFALYFSLKGEHEIHDQENSPTFVIKRGDGSNRIYPGESATYEVELHGYEGEIPHLEWSLFFPNDNEEYQHYLDDGLISLVVDPNDPTKVEVVISDEINLSQNIEINLSVTIEGKSENIEITIKANNWLSDVSLSTYEMTLVSGTSEQLQVIIMDNEEYQNDDPIVITPFLTSTNEDLKISDYLSLYHHYDDATSWSVNTLSGIKDTEVITVSFDVTGYKPQEDDQALECIVTIIGTDDLRSLSQVKIERKSGNHLLHSGEEALYGVNLITQGGEPYTGSLNEENMKWSVELAKDNLREEERERYQGYIDQGLIKLTLDEDDLTKVTMSVDQKVEIIDEIEINLSLMIVDDNGNLITSDCVSIPIVSTPIIIESASLSPSYLEIKSGESGQTNLIINGSLSFEEVIDLSYSIDRGYEQYVRDIALSNYAPSSFIIISIDEGINKYVEEFDIVFTVNGYTNESTLTLTIKIIDESDSRSVNHVEIELLNGSLVLSYGDSSTFRANIKNSSGIYPHTSDFTFDWALEEENGEIVDHLEMTYNRDLIIISVPSNVELYGEMNLTLSVNVIHLESNETFHDSLSLTLQGGVSLDDPSDEYPDGFSWEAIEEIAHEGKAKDYFHLGDTKTMTYTYDNLVYETEVRIIGFNHDTLVTNDSSYNLNRGQAAITFETVDVLPIGTMSFDDDIIRGGSEEVGWSSSKLREKMQEGGKIYHGLDEEVKEIIKNVKKTTNVTRYLTPKESHDSFFILSACEIWSKNSLLNSTTSLLNQEYRNMYLIEGEQYEYYQHHLGDQDPKDPCSSLIKSGTWFIRSPQIELDQTPNHRGLSIYSPLLTGLESDTRGNLNGYEYLYNPQYVSMCFCI